MLDDIIACLQAIASGDTTAEPSEQFSNIGVLIESFTLEAGNIRQARMGFTAQLNDAQQNNDVLDEVEGATPTIGSEEELIVLSEGEFIVE